MSSLHALSFFIFRHTVIYSWERMQSAVSAYRQSPTYRRHKGCLHKPPYLPQTTAPLRGVIPTLFNK